MQIIRTIIWIAITAVLVAFVAMNWNRAPINIWPLEDTYLMIEWPVGIIAVAFFLLGLVPMWLLSRATRWRMKRRIATLENSLKAASAPTPSPPIATSTQLAAATLRAEEFPPRP